MGKTDDMTTDPSPTAPESSTPTPDAPVFAPPDPSLRSGIDDDHRAAFDPDAQVIIGV